ncbi:MAG: hypothetical protein LBQ14_00355 [Treponema sp.]|nr:hypothetical protein [Treponema sp.]
MKDSTKARILAAGLGVAAMLTPAACDNGTGTDPCRCPDKIHGSALCGCGGADCVCEQKEWALDYNIKVINETGEKLRAGLITDVTSAMNVINGEDVSLMSVISARNVTISITTGEDDAVTYNTITIGSQYMISYNAIKGNLEYMFGEMKAITE